MAAFLGVTFPGKGYKGRGVLLWKRNQAEWTEAKPLISRWVGGRQWWSGWKWISGSNPSQKHTPHHSEVGQINSQSHTFEISSFRMDGISYAMM